MMKFTKVFQNMYYVTIAVLLVVAVVESIGRGFPVNLVVAVATTSVLDVAIKRFWLKRKPGIPLSAIITGFIIGTVSVNAPVGGAVVAAVLAILSKFVIRWQGSHIFNPAVFGVVITQLLSPAAHGPASSGIAHGGSAVVEGFGPGGFTVSLWLVPLLFLANYKATKIWVALPLLLATAVLFHFTGLARLDVLRAQDMLRFLEALPWYFACIIASEPRTSPYAKKEQVVFGIGVAVLSLLPLLLLGSYSHIGALVALLVGNLMYAAYRVATRG